MKIAASTPSPVGWVRLLMVAVSCWISLGAEKVPRLSPIGDDDNNIIPGGRVFSKDEGGGLKTYYYNQTLDHFNYRSEETFRQRYMVDTTMWGGPESKAPIFAYFGAEASIEYDAAGIGFMYNTAPQFRPLILFIEHRYYGESVPFGSREEAFSNLDRLGYFDSAQAIADYAQLILHVKEAYNATYSPVIVVGGSYGGMLASWFRLKYPHIAMGALASSAPILYFDNITPQEAYFDVVSQDFRAQSKKCYRSIKRSWLAIKSLASRPRGLSVLSNIFRTCTTLKSGDEVEHFLIRMLATAAQYNRPPRYAVKEICDAIDGAPSGSNVLSKISAGVFAYYQGRNNYTCFVNRLSQPSETDIGWGWQRCSEMVMPIAIGKKSMFPADEGGFDWDTFIQRCQTSYGVTVRPHWVTTYYGGQDLNLILKRFGSNIIFSNGLKDPYSSGGVLEDISNSIVAVTTAEGSHCMDILYASESDPEWLVNQRLKEVSIIQGWLAQYNDDLKVSEP